MPQAKHTSPASRYRLLLVLLLGLACLLSARSQPASGKPPQRRQAEGTGLGLAISQEIVRHHEGEIGFDAKPGEGSFFYFTLPVIFERDLRHS